MLKNMYFLLNEIACQQWIRSEIRRHFWCSVIEDYKEFKRFSHFSLFLCYVTNKILHKIVIEKHRNFSFILISQSRLMSKKEGRLIKCKWKMTTATVSIEWWWRHVSALIKMLPNAKSNLRQKCLKMYGKIIENFGVYCLEIEEDILISSIKCRMIF